MQSESEFWRSAMREDADDVAETISFLGFTERGADAQRELDAGFDIFWRRRERSVYVNRAYARKIWADELAVRLGWTRGRIVVQNHEVAY